MNFLMIIGPPLEQLQDLNIPDISDHIFIVL